MADEIELTAEVQADIEVEWSVCRCGTAGCGYVVGSRLVGLNVALSGVDDDDEEDEVDTPIVVEG